MCPEGAQCASGERTTVASWGHSEYQTIEERNKSSTRKQQNRVFALPLLLLFFVLKLFSHDLAHHPL